MAEKKQKLDELPTCGIIMPIGEMPPAYDAHHWSDVKRVLEKAISDSNMTPQIVSSSFESDVIQSRIINNLYNNPVVVCDVSGLNPNVMFELGVRITFGKPVIVVTDNLNNIPFDTKVIEHLSYPSDLHIHKTTDFQIELTQKIVDLNNRQSSGTYKSVIETFGNFEVFEPKSHGVAGDKYLAERLDYVVGAIDRLERRSENLSRPNQFYKPAGSTAGGLQTFSLEVEQDIAEKVASKIIDLPEVMRISHSILQDDEKSRLQVTLSAQSASQAREVRQKISAIAAAVRRSSANK